MSQHSQVNQTLLFARMQLEHARQPHSRPDSALRQQAYVRAACSELRHTYIALLNEIGAAYRVALHAPILSVDELCHRLNTINKHPSEIEELKELLNNPSSWLSQLLQAYEQLLSGHVHAATPINPQIIAVAANAHTSDALTASAMQVVSDEMQALIERLRSVYFEY